METTRTGVLVFVLLESIFLECGRQVHGDRKRVVVQVFLAIPFMSCVLNALKTASVGSYYNVPKAIFYLLKGDYTYSNGAGWERQGSF